MKIDWQDAEEIAASLFDRHPETDPLTLRFTDLHRMVMELPGFEGDQKSSTEGILEAIQMAWYALYQDRYA